MKTIIAYTDGACKNNQSGNGAGGYGAILMSNIEIPFGIKDENEFRIFGGSKKTTNNIMELTAVIKTLEFAEKQSKEDIDLLIYSDSAYIVNCMNDKWYKKWQDNGWKTSKKTPVENRELWERVLELQKGFKRITFKKVKGHAGDTYNEIADMLANEGASLAEDDIGCTGVAYVYDKNKNVLGFL